MTDEEVIIDGVDVSGCEFLCNGAYWCEQHKILVGTKKIQKGDGLIACKDKTNCYYKQLQRKEQECEEHLKERDNLLDECIRYQEEKGKLRKSQFCIAYEKDCYKECKQENCTIKNSYRYKQALDEIAPLLKSVYGSLLEIVNHYIQTYLVKEGCDTLDVVKQILDIIDEANKNNTN